MVLHNRIRHLHRGHDLLPSNSQAVEAQHEAAPEDRGAFDIQLPPADDSSLRLPRTYCLSLCALCAATAGHRRQSFGAAGHVDLVYFLGHDPQHARLH